MKKDEIGLLVWGLVATLFFAAVLCWMTSCSDECDPLETRCVDNAVEICNDEERWELALDCSAIVATSSYQNWICCLESESNDYSCKPAEFCGDGGTE